MHLGNGPDPLELLTIAFAWFGALCLLGLCALAFEPTFRGFRDELRHFVRQTWRWHRLNPRQQVLGDDWRPRDTSHLWDALRRRR